MQSSGFFFCWEFQINVVEPGKFKLYKSYKTNFETENFRKVNIFKDLPLHNLNVGYSQLEFNGAIKGEPFHERICILLLNEIG